MPVVDLPFGVEPFEDLALMRIGPHLESGDGDAAAVGASTAGLGEGIIEAVGVHARVVQLVGGICPVGLERGGELGQ